MKKLIRWCSSCDEYTFQRSCSNCGEATINPHPARFSPQDKYGAYRRALKKDQA